VITTAGAAAPAPNGEMKMKNFTIFFRAATDGLTGYAHVTRDDIENAYEIFLHEYPHTEIIGACDGHVTPLWWEKP
jgi:hypothetical protein